jgi:DNA polymerase zeta
MVSNQVGKQNAAECMPLTLEPSAAFYNSPLLVLDFQSLYPSVMIAYNYCYSTCLGRTFSHAFHDRLGVVDFKLRPRLLNSLETYITGKYPIASM